MSLQPEYEFSSEPKGNTQLKKGTDNEQKQSHQSLSELQLENQDNEAVYITELNGEFVAVNYNSYNKDPQLVSLSTNTLTETEEQEIELASATATASQLQSQQQRARSFSGKKGLAVGIGLGVILAVGGMRLFAPSSTETTNTSNVDPTVYIAPKQSVTVVEVKTGQIKRTLNMTGTAAAYELIPVKSPAMGLQIKEILVDRGAYVEKGQVLARLGNDILQAELVQAQAEVKEEKANLAELKAGNLPEEIAQSEQRVRSAAAAVVQAESDLDLVQKRAATNKNLAAEGAITRDRLNEILNEERINQSNLEQAQARLQEAQQQLAQLRRGARPEAIAQAEAALAQAEGRVQSIQAQLADTIITAPVSGKIAERDARIGDLTSASENLFTIIENGRLELQVEMPETLLGQIRPGQTVQVTSDVNSNLKLLGKIREINPILEEDIPQATVKIDLPKETDLKPGMFLRSAIETSTAEGQIVPMDALLPQSNDTAIAYVVQPDNTVKAQSVQMGEILPDQQVEVVNGLQPGDRIVVEGAAYLKDGDSVQIAN